MTDVFSILRFGDAPDHQKSKLFGAWKQLVQSPWMSLSPDIQIQPAKEAKTTVRNLKDFFQTVARGLVMWQSYLGSSFLIFLLELSELVRNAVNSGQKWRGQKQAIEFLWWLCPSCCFQVTDEDEEEAEEVDQDQCFPLFSKPKAQRHDFSCNHQEESSESSESSDSRVRSNVTSASSANTSNKQAVLGAHSRRSVGARRRQLCFRLAVAAISWLASIISLMRCEVKLLIRSNTEGSTVCATLWHYGWCFLLEI